MFRLLQTRVGHYLALLLLAACLYFPHLGTPSLWDIDEGNNAEAAREMLESENWVVPTFNYELRVDKPALLYWLQIQAYQYLDVTEFAARLPSALAATLTLLVVYELGRLLFSSTTAFLGALVLASNIAFGVAARFANPDALLNLFAALSFFFFWRSYSTGGRGWFVSSSICMGLAVLTKGPVGIVLPAAVITFFLWHQGRLSLLWDRRYLLACLVFALVAAPWYAWVAADTKASFLTGFLLKHNVGRYLSPMENHNGPFFYYLIVLAIGLAPWSIVLGATVWFSTGARARSDEVLPRYGSFSRGTALLSRPEGSGEPSYVASIPAGVIRNDAYSFLWWWIGMYLVFFSLAGTKLPNYILPLYAPVALLIGRFLDRWLVQATIRMPAWSVTGSLACLVLIGVGVMGGFLAAGGAVGWSALKITLLPGLERWAALGFLPILGAVAMAWCLRRSYTLGALGSLAATAVAFSGLLLGGAALDLDKHKAPRSLIEVAGARQLDHEIRVAAYEYFQPSLVFYCQREVFKLQSEHDVAEILAKPIPVYVFLPRSVWEQMTVKQGKPWRVLTTHHDLYRRCEIVAISNQAAEKLADRRPDRVAQASE